MAGCWVKVLWAGVLVVGCAEAPRDPVDRPDEVELHTPAEVPGVSPADEGGERESADTAQEVVGDAFADRVVSFTPGEAAGFGGDAMPDVVLGPPRGAGASAGSLDVVSLGRGGEIVLAFDDRGVIDGPGPDLLVFENPFSGFFEPGRVAVSEDGESWHEWPCDATDVEHDYPGCAGVAAVLSYPGGPDATDPATAGGDAFDLADLGISRARFVRVRDAEGPNTWYMGVSGGFDLDAVAVVHAE